MAAPTESCNNRRLLTNIHDNASVSSNKSYVVRGKYEYYHYGCDNFDDRGWGCGYRTLQSLCSWLRHELTTTGKAAAEVPSIPAIQEALVTMGDKPERFKNSRDWIGSFEVCICLDYFYDTPCKIIHVNSGRELENHVEELVEHFKTFGSPVMMGGESDSSSKGILGVSRNPSAFLIMDPHYYGPTRDSDYLTENGWLSWRQLKEFQDHTFYNLCLPKLKSGQIT